MPVYWWKVPTFFWIGLHLQPLLSSCPLAQQPTFSLVLPPQYCLCQHDFRASWGVFWLRSQRLSAELWRKQHGSDFLRSDYAMLSAIRAPQGLLWRGKLSTAWEQHRVGALLPTLKLHDHWLVTANPDIPDSEGPAQVFGFTIWTAL